MGVRAISLDANTAGVARAQGRERCSTVSGLLQCYHPNDPWSSQPFDNILSWDSASVRARSAARLAYSDNGDGGRVAPASKIDFDRATLPSDLESG